MLCVSTQAQEVLRDVLNRKNLNDQEMTFRLRVMQDNNTRRKQFGLILDYVQEGDQVVEHNGRKVLLIDERTSRILDGVMLRAIDTPRGRRLRFQRMRRSQGE